MATIATSDSALHHDMRAESHAFKRDKDSVSKWAHGHRDVAYAADLRRGGGLAAQLPYKVRPGKRYSEIARGAHKTSNGGSDAAVGRARNRIARKYAANYESALPTTKDEITRSLLMDMLPNKTFQPSFNEPGIHYSFDAQASLHKNITLGDLVDVAEKKFLSTETDKIIDEEYETLDGSGEVQNRGLGRGKKARKGLGKVVMGSLEEDEAVVVDDDWELLSNGGSRV